MTHELSGGGSRAEGAGQPLPGLDGGLVAIVEQNLKTGSSEGFSEAIGSHLQDRDTAAIVGSLVSVLTALKQNDPGYLIESGEHLQQASRERVIGLITLCVDRAPEAVGDLLAKPEVNEDPLLTDQPTLEALPGAVWKKRDESTPASRVLAFAVRHAVHRQQVVQAFAETVAPDPDLRQAHRLEIVKGIAHLAAEDLSSEEYQTVTEAIRGAIIARQQVDAAEVAQEAKRQKLKADWKELISNNQAVESAEQAMMAKLEQEQDRREEAEWKKLGDDLIHDPAKTYWEYISGDRPLTRDTPKALLSVASRYLSAVDGDGDSYLTKQAMAILHAHFGILVDSGKPVCTNVMFAQIAPHLHRLFPDAADLVAYMDKNLAVRSDDELQMAWKKSFAGNKRRKEAEALVGSVDAKELHAQGVEKLIIEPVEYKGIEYTDIEEMYEDLRKYFVYPVGYEPQGGDDLPLWSQANLSVIEDLLVKRYKGGAFRMPSTIHTRSQYPNATNIWHSVGINVSDGESSEGQPVFRLKLNDYENFAAFVGKDITYGSESLAIIKYNLAAQPGMSESDKRFLHEALQASDIQPGLATAADTNMGRPLTVHQEVWPFAFDKRPNQAVARLLRQTLGGARISYALGDHKVWDNLHGQHVPEVQQSLHVTFKPAGKEELQRRTVALSDIAKFSVAATPAQVKLLRALKEVVPQAKTITQAMLS